MFVQRVRGYKRELQGDKSKYKANATSPKTASTATDTVAANIAATVRWMICNNTENVLTSNPDPGKYKHSLNTLMSLLASVGGLV